MHLMATRAGFLSLLCLGAQGAELLLQPASASAGSIAPLVLRFEPAGVPVAALQFDLESDAPLTLASSPGPAALSAAKGLFSAPSAGRRTRFVVVGMNRNLLDGGVIAAINAFVSASAADGTYAFRLTNLSACDPEGNAVPITSSAGSLTIGSDEPRLLSGVFPQLATGGGWKTSYTLLNLANRPQLARLTFWDNEGAPLSVPVVFSPELGLPPVVGAAAELQLAANSMAVLEVETAAPEVTTGWARLHAPAGIAGSATFRYRAAEGQEQEAVVPLETRKPYSYVLPYDNTAGFTAGIAVANDSDHTAASIAIVLRDSEGRQLLTDTMALPVRGHAYFALTSRYPGLAGVRGTMEVKDLSGGNLAVLGLRFNPAGSVTSIPAEAK
jgi:hypothetical protein